MKLRAAWNRFWFAPGHAEDLAISRILFASGMLAFTLTRALHEWGEVPPAYLQPARFFGILGLPVAGTDLLQALEAVWHVALASLALGCFTRSSAALVALLSLYLFGIDAPELLGRSYTPAVFVPAVLAFARSGDALSIDAWRRRRRSRPLDALPEEYGWPCKAICVFLAYVFFASGVAKIRHTGFPDWMLSEMTYRGMLVGNYWYASRGQAPLPIGATLLGIDERFGVALGIVTQVTELGYPSALFFRPARFVAVPLMLALLTGIALAMGPFFWLTMLAHVFWVPWWSLLRVTNAGRP